MAGRIRDEDISTVRERSRIDEVVSAHVTLRSAGSGSMKGLCPFHDEKSPSFHVTPSRGFFHCFGCQEGGDVITFVQKIEGVSFTEAVERLADRYHVALRYDDAATGSGHRRERGQRSRLVEAHRLAAEFYEHQLQTPDAVTGRHFLDERGFDRAAAAIFGIGFAPRDGDALLQHLRGKGFQDDELTAAGLVARNNRGPYDRFRGRLLWPIRELSGDVVGFGARRLFDDDHVEAKYLNTPETAIYKKSQLLYGVHLARKDIARASQAVVVEGYTDVMACHLSGVTTAVATCGTAFGEDHGRILRRLLLDHDEFRGEVIFTFDGDEAGQKAALRAFDGDQQFVGQTYVAVEPDGRDPCELRQAEGEAAVRELIARRVPLYRFVLGNVVSRFDLDRADARVDAVREAARLVASIRDRSKVDAFARELAGMVGVEVEEVRAEVRRASIRPLRTSRGAERSRASAPARQNSAAVSDAAQLHRPVRDKDLSDGAGQSDQDGRVLGGQRPSEEVADGVTAPQGDPTRPGNVGAGGPGNSAAVPDPLDRRFSIERDVLKLALQHPTETARAWRELESEDFTHPWYRTVFDLARAGGDLTAGTADTLLATSDPVRSTVSALTVEPLHVSQLPDEQVASAFVVRLRELTALRRIQQLKGRLQRMNPVTQVADYNRLFGELVALEAHRRTLRERAIGSSI
ncbi:MAG: DNA primase [Nocardioidaceae bacterium]|nr:DNA primase [Nocardioidaceae bacterium]